MLDLHRCGTQAEFGIVAGITQQAVSELIARRVLAPSQTLHEWNMAYCSHLREVAAGRASSGLSTERARLAKEQADRVAMENAKTRRETAPLWTLEIVLAGLVRQIVGVLDTIPVNIKRRVGGIPTEAIEFIEREIIRARNTASEIEFNWDELLSGQDGDAGPSGDAESLSEGAGAIPEA